MVSEDILEVLKTLYNYVLSVTQGPTIWVPGLLGIWRGLSMGARFWDSQHWASGLEIELAVNMQKMKNFPIFQHSSKI